MTTPCQRTLFWSDLAAPVMLLHKYWRCAPLIVSAFENFFKMWSYVGVLKYPWKQVFAEKHFQPPYVPLD
jgi:hypothetical protein